MAYSAWEWNQGLTRDRVIGEYFPGLGHKDLTGDRTLEVVTKIISPSMIPI